MLGNFFRNIEFDDETKRSIVIAAIIVGIALGSQIYYRIRDAFVDKQPVTTEAQAEKAGRGQTDKTEKKEDEGIIEGLGNDIKGYIPQNDFSMGELNEILKENGVTVDEVRKALDEETSEESPKSTENTDQNKTTDQSKADTSKEETVKEDATEEKPAEKETKEEESSEKTEEVADPAKDDKPKGTEVKEEDNKKQEKQDTSEQNTKEESSDNKDNKEDAEQKSEAEKPDNKTNK